MGKVNSDIVRAVLTEYLRKDTRFQGEITGETILLGRDGIFDSMSMVAFILDLEEKSGKALLDLIMNEAQKKGLLRLSELEAMVGGSET